MSEEETQRQRGRTQSRDGGPNTEIEVVGKTEICTQT